MGLELNFLRRFHLGVAWDITTRQNIHSQYMNNNNKQNSATGEYEINSMLMYVYKYVVHM